MTMNILHEVAVIVACLTVVTKMADCIYTAAEAKPEFAALLTRSLGGGEKKPICPNVNRAQGEMLFASFCEKGLFQHFGCIQIHPNPPSVPPPLTPADIPKKLCGGSLTAIGNAAKLKREECNTFVKDKLIPRLDEFACTDSNGEKIKWAFKQYAVVNDVVNTIFSGLI